MLNLSAEIALVSEHEAVMIFTLCIIQIMYIVHVCSGHVIGVYDSAYSTDSVQLIAIVIHLLRSTISVSRSSIGIVAPHCAPLGSRHLADLDGLGVDDEHILASVYLAGYILAYLLSKHRRKFPSDIELTHGYEIGHLLERLIEPFEEKILAVISERLRCKRQIYHLQVGEC